MLQGFRLFRLNFTFKVFEFEVLLLLLSVPIALYIDGILVFGKLVIGDEKKTKKRRKK